MSVPKSCHNGTTTITLHMEDELQSWFPSQAAQRFSLYMKLLLYQDIGSQRSGSTAHIKSLQIWMTHTPMSLLTSTQTHSLKNVPLWTDISSYKNQKVTSQQIDLCVYVCSNTEHCILDCKITISSFIIIFSLVSFKKYKSKYHPFKNTIFWHFIGSPLP